MSRIDKAYSFLFHPLRENPNSHRKSKIAGAVAAWIASFGLAPAIVAGIKKHRIRVEERQEPQEPQGTELLDVFSQPAINERLFHFLGDEIFKMEGVAKPFKEVLKSPRLTKINEGLTQSLQDLGLKTVDAVKDFTSKHGGEIFSLNLSEYTITDEDLEAILQNCPLLNKLKIQSPLITHKGIRTLAKSLENLQELNLNGCFNITDADVRTIVRNRKQLTSLSLKDTGVTDVGVQSIAKHLKGLKKLDLSNCRIGSKSIKAITENLIDLEELKLAECRLLVKEDIIAIANSLANLRSLYLDFTTPIDNEDCQLIAERLPRLTHLSLQNCFIESAGIVILSSLENLKLLNLSYCPVSIDGVRSIATNLPHLEELYMNRTYIRNEDVSFLARQLHQLRTLHLVSSSLSSSSIEVIARNLTQLTDLNLSKSMINGEAAAAMVEHLRGLTSLNLCSCDISNDDLQSILENFRNLKKLNLMLQTNLPTGVVRTIATHQKNLEELNLNNTDINEGFLEITENLRHLKVLDLSFSHIGKAEARAIARNLPNLKDLNLTSCRNMENSDFRYLMKNLKNLKSLNLSSNHINNHTLYTIAKYQKSLLHLILAENDFSDRAVVSISRSIPTLRVLDLYGCRRITDKSVRSILQNLNLRVLRIDQCFRVSVEARRAAQKTLNQV